MTVVEKRAVQGCDSVTAGPVFRASRVRRAGWVFWRAGGARVRRHAVQVQMLLCKKYHSGTPFGAGNARLLLQQASFSFPVA